jgi:hypothetical protein
MFETIILRCGITWKEAMRALLFALYQRWQGSVFPSLAQTKPTCEAGSEGSDVIPSGVYDSPRPTSTFLPG